MSCSLDKELLERYIDGDVDLLERIILENHLKVCPECALIFAELEWIARATNDLGQLIDYPPELRSLARDTLDQLVPHRSTLSTLRNTAENATRFIRFLPGLPTATAVTRKSVQAAPKLVWSLTSNVVRGGFKLAQLLV